MVQREKPAHLKVFSAIVDPFVSVVFGKEFREKTDMIPSCWKITKILNSSIIYCAHNFLENACFYIYTVVDRRPKFPGKVLSPCFPLSLIAVELDRKRRFNKPMDLEALAYIHACWSATLKKWPVDLEEIFKKW